jgi:hypothetical protein
MSSWLLTAHFAHHDDDDNDGDPADSGAVAGYGLQIEVLTFPRATCR